MAVSNVIGGIPISPKTIMLQTGDGRELPAILVDEETIFTATTNDVRVGKVFATDTGVKTGHKIILEYQYSYALIDENTKICLGIFAGTTPIENPLFIAIPVYDSEYSNKYYINGNWYEDSAGTIPWESSMV